MNHQMKTWRQSLKNLFQIKGYWDKYENIAIISNATKQNQKTLISTLTNSSKDFDKGIIDSPALLVIGKNVLLSPILNWYLQMPLI